MRTRNQISLLIVCWGLFCLVSCTQQKKECCSSDQIIGTGDLIQQNIVVSPFSKINLVGSAQISIAKGDTQSILIKAQQNILDAMNNAVSGNTFNIAMKNNYSVQTSKGIFVTIVTPNPITDISIIGAGAVNILGPKQNSLSLNITGSGDIDSYGLMVDNVSVTITGAGNCKVNAQVNLNVTIAGTGNVSYKGKPAINQSISGIGTIVNDN
jgi:hypothetical protein